MEMLPEDLIMDILSRHSVKFLLRLRCVSKPFCSLIDSQEFIKIHLKRSTETDSNLSLILSGSPSPIVACSRYWHGEFFSASLDSLDIAVELDHPFNNCEGETPVIDSCNGLITLKNSENVIALWNPSTGEYLILPKFWSDVKDSYFFVDGFGYDAASDDYKVVRITQFDTQNVVYTELAVCSLKTKSSIRFRVDFPCYFPHPFDGTFANGYVHWLIAKTPDATDEDVILAFDLKGEEFYEVQLPPLENRKSVYLLYIGTFRGCLYFSCLVGDPGPMDIWLLKDSWTKTFSIPRAFFGGFDYAKALAYSNSGDKLLVDTYTSDPDDEDEDNNKWELYWYDLQNQRAAGQVTIHGVPQGCRDSIICVDSLVSLAAYTGRGV